MSVPLLNLFFICAASVSCMGEKCWEQPRHICQSSTCDDVHIIDRISKYKDHVCPKREGQAVVLCQSYPWHEPCHVMHITKGQSCSNVDPEINDLHRSIIVLDGCTRMYEKANCQGQMEVLNTTSWYIRLPQEWKHMVRSVGICSKGDRLMHGFYDNMPLGTLVGQARKCYWLDRQNCGEGSTCGEDHFMWIGSQNKTCGGQPTKFCCPKSDGHDVVLCQHFDLEGECIVKHIPKGQTCVSIEGRYNNWVSSVHSLEACVKAYKYRYCTGEVVIIHKNKDGFNAPLGYDDLILSVGLCSPDDDADAGCNRGSPKGRSKCPEKKCYWLDEPNCGEDSTCGNDHLMWIGFQSKACHGQPTKFCCPMSDGHDVVLCQHFDLWGECIITHIPKGQICANISNQYINWASSVHSLEGCIKVYASSDCGGEMIMFYKNKDGFNTPRGFKHIIKSVGLCSHDNSTTADCSRASPEGRSKCTPHTLLPPRLISNTEERQVTHSPESAVPKN